MLVVVAACGSKTTPRAAEGDEGAANKRSVVATGGARVEVDAAGVAESGAGAAPLPTACDGVDVIELGEANRPTVALPGVRVGAVVLVPRDLASRAPAEAQTLAGVAEMMAYDALTPGARAQLAATAQATLFPALRTYQAAHDQRVVGSFVVIDTFVLVLQASGAVDAMIEGTDAAGAAGCARERATAVNHLEDLRRQKADMMKRLEQRRPKGKGHSSCTDNPLAPGC